MHAVKIDTFHSQHYRAPILESLNHQHQPGQFQKCQK